MSFNPKFLMFAAATALFGALWAYFNAAFLNPAAGASSWPSLVFGALFLSFYMLRDVYAPSTKEALTIALVEIVEIIFASGVSLVWGAAAAIFFLFAANHGKSDATLGLKIDLRNLAHSVGPKTITAMAIIVSALYTSTAFGDNFSLSKPAAISILSPVIRSLSFFIPGVNAATPVGDALAGFTKNILAGQLAALPPAERDAAIRQATAKTLQSLEGALGTPISGRDSILDAVRRSANAGLAQIPQNFRPYILFGFAALVFLTIKGFGFLLVYIVYLVAWALHKLFLKVGFVKIVTEQVAKESVLF